MDRKRERSTSRERLSPTATLSNLSDEFMAGLRIPALPEQIPQRLESAVRTRVNALLFRLKEAKNEQYVRVLEARLVRDSLRAVLTAFELGLADREVMYATFRRAVEELGYESADAGFIKGDDQESSPGE
jgi:hypothetical protein